MKNRFMGSTKMRSNSSIDKAKVGLRHLLLSQLYFNFQRCGL